MSFENIPGQPRTKRFLKQLMHRGHVPHAFLFSGIGGAGKRAMAREFAKLLNCRNPRDLDSCDACPSCRKMDGEHHPDLIWVSREGKYIKIEQIRELQGRLRFRPFEAAWRTLIIHNAQDLKEEAANALLKLLEEPPRNNIFVLTTLEPQMLLPTLVSRCCNVRFQPMEDEWVKEHLIQMYEMSPHNAEKLARLAAGNLERAQWLAEENHMDHWQEIAKRLQELSDLPMLEFFALMAQWVQKSEDLEQDLECVKFWLRDLIFSRVLGEHRTVFPLQEKLRNILVKVSTETLYVLYNHVEQAVQRLRQNANKQLTLEGVCLAIKDGLYGQGRWNSFSQRRQNLSF